MASVPTGVGGGGGGLTSTTAPGKIFSSRSELASHYKSDWHRYNLKRREAGLPAIREVDFEARLEAALAARKEREERERGAGRGHLKDKTGGGRKKNKGRGKGGKGMRLGGAEEEGEPSTDAAPTGADSAAAASASAARPMEADGSAEGGAMPEGAEEEEEEEEPPNIDPYESLFDSHTSPTLELNLEHMSKSHGFFVPDSEYLTDLEGLLGYCHEKVKLGRTCLYCQRTFRTWEGCRRHMVDSRHAKLRYERGIDLEEFDVFYDFSEADAEFLGGAAPRRKKRAAKEEGAVEYMDDGEGDEDDDSAEWEDISDDEDDADMDEEDDEDDDDLYGYEAELATHGFDVTPLGELVFPDGRIVGHRGLSRYYKQNVRGAGPSERAAVVAARQAAGERVFAGRVYDTRSGRDDAHGETSLALMRAGLDPAAARARGRAAQGILVEQAGGGGGGGGGFTALSLYRYRAAVRKSRRDEDGGRRLKQRSGMNTNRMDKKANRLMTGVSVAHAPR